MTPPTTPEPTLPAATAPDAADTPVTAAPVEQDATPADKAPGLSPAECANQLKERFPALFAGPAKPLKLRIQADIQERAPGVFSKQALSGFFRRYTGSTSYLLAVSRAKERFDLDGLAAGELSDEHREIAVQELARRKTIQTERRQAENQARAERAGILADVTAGKLTAEAYCADKGVTPEAFEALLVKARQEAAEPRPERADRGPRGGQGRPGQGPRREGGDRPRGDRPAREARPQGDRPARADKPQGERPPRAERPQGDRPQGDRPRGDRRDGHRAGAPSGERGPRPEGERRPERAPRVVNPNAPKSALALALEAAKVKSSK
jgi:ProP effector